MTDKVVRPLISRRKFLQSTAATAGVLALGDVIAGHPGSALFQPAEAAPAAKEEKWIPTSCWVGKHGCVMQAHVVDGKVVEFKGDPKDVRNQGRLCLKGHAQLATMYDPYRLKTPLIRTNGKGVHGEWKEASWDEALTLVANKIQEARNRDKRLFVTRAAGFKRSMPGRTAFNQACGSVTYGDISCGQPHWLGNVYTVGLQSGYHADLKHTKYLLAWGSNLTDGGPNGNCWIQWAQQVTEARERGMKVITIDPRLEGGGPHSDEWLPIKPGADLALLLAMMNVLIANGYVDKPYLLNYTNSPFLVQADGKFLRVDGKEQVWDAASNAAKPFDTKGLTPALEGSFTVGGAAVKTSFQLLTEHVAQYSPESVAAACGVPAEQIRRIALELGKNACIGQTITIDGVQLPYRPVAMMGYHGIAGQEHAFQCGRAGCLLFMLLGAIQAVGGVRIGFGLAVAPNFTALDKAQIKDPPYNINLTNSKYFAINHPCSAFASHVLLNPQKYEVGLIPEVMLCFYGNYLLSSPPTDVMIEALKKMKFIADIDSHLTEEADLLADVVLPCSVLEKLDGPVDVNNMYETGWMLRLPVTDPLYKSRPDLDIYIDLAEKMGILYGKDGFIDKIHGELTITDANKLDINTKPTTRQVFDAWAKSRGVAEGVAYFEKNSAKTAPIPVKQLYAPAWDPPYGGIRHRVWGESLLGYRETMKSKGAAEVYYRDYTALPTWRPNTMDSSPAEYDLYLIDHKAIQLFHSQLAYNPLLNELDPAQALRMNPRTAKAKGLADGDEVWVESHNATSGQTKKFKMHVRYVEGIRPDTVAMAHGYGHWVHPVAKNDGPSPSQLYYTGEGYTVSVVQGGVFRVKVKVWKV